MTSLKHTLRYLNTSRITLKALDTGQVIYPSTEKWCEIIPLDDKTCRIKYRFSQSDTRATLLVSEENGELSFTVERYLPSPIFNTKCGVYLNGQRVKTLEETIPPIVKTIPIPLRVRPSWPLRSGPLRKVVHVDTFGVQCGIATYLEAIMDRLVPLDESIEQIVFAEEIPEGDERASTGKDYSSNQPTIIRNWVRKRPMPGIFSDLSEFDPDILHVQHEWSFFPARDMKLIQFLNQSKGSGTANVITWHTVYGEREFNRLVLDRFFDAINPVVDAHIVHEVNSLRNLRFFKIPPERIHHIPMSAYSVRDIDKDEARRKMLPEEYWGKKLLLTGGFLLPNKGVEKILMAMSLMKEKDIALICIGGSHPWSVQFYKDYYNLIVKTAEQTGVDLYLDYRFMDDEEISYYMACADIVILYYGWTLSGTSGWSRRAIASRRPTIATDVRLMSDLEDGVHCVKVPSRNIGKLYNAIHDLLENEELQRHLVDNAVKYALEISPENIAKRHLELYREVYESCQKK